MKFRYAMVCSSNQNRSMEAHSLLKKQGFEVSSYGTGAHVKLPGPSLREPNVYEFGTPYKHMYDDLRRKDSELYPLLSFYSFFFLHFPSLYPKIKSPTCGVASTKKRFHLFSFNILLSQVFFFSIFVRELGFLLFFVSLIQMAVEGFSYIELMMGILTFIIITGEVLLVWFFYCLAIWSLFLCWQDIEIKLVFIWGNSSETKENQFLLIFVFN